MTEGAIVQMRHAHRRIGASRIMTGRAGRRTRSHIAKRHMIDAAVRDVLTRMTRQAVGRVGAQGDRIDDLLARAAMAGGAGAGAVGRHIMLGGIDFGPGRDHMAGAAGHAVGQIAAAQGNGMGISRMFRIETASMAGRAVAGSGLADGRADQGAGGGVMTADAGVVGLGCRTDQGVVVAARTVGRTDGDDAAVVGDGGRMQRLPAAGVAGGAVAGSGLADGRADQNAGLVS